METDLVIRRLRKLIEVMREQGYMSKEIVAYICIGLNRSDCDEEFAEELYSICEEAKEWKILNFET